MTVVYLCYFSGGDVSTSIYVYSCLDPYKCNLIKAYMHWYTTITLTANDPNNKTFIIIILLSFFETTKNSVKLIICMFLFCFVYCCLLFLWRVCAALTLLPPGGHTTDYSDLRWPARWPHRNGEEKPTEKQKHEASINLTLTYNHFQSTFFHFFAVGADPWGLFEVSRHLTLRYVTLHPVSRA